MHDFELSGTQFNSPQLMDKIFAATAPNRHWRSLVAALNPGSQYDLLCRLMKGPQPTRHDWVNIFNPVSYEFREGWHFRAILVLFAIVSIIALGKMATIALDKPRPDSLPLLPLLAANVGLIVYWIILLRFSFAKASEITHKGIEEYLFTCLCMILAPLLALIVLIISIIPVIGSILKFKRVKINTEDTVKSPSIGESIAIFFAILAVLIIAPPVCSLLIWPLAATGYFVTLLLLVYFPWAYLLFFWMVFLGTGVALWLVGRRLHRAAQNPLSNILELIKTFPGVPPQKSRIWFFLLWLLRRW